MTGFFITSIVVLFLLVWIVVLSLFVWIAVMPEKAPKFSQAQAADQAREELLCASSDDDDPPHVYVHCDYNPDEIKTFYEVPDALVEMVRPAESRLTFVECLAGLVNMDEPE